MTAAAPCPLPPDPTAPACLCLDIETSKHDRLRLHEVGAWRSDTGAQLHLKGDAPKWATQLNALTAGAQALLGHNITAFDQPALAALHPELALHQLPQIDTLALSPIAYPQNPYHRLVKDYKLCTTSRNDPVRDAQLAWTLFQEQSQALQERIAQHPDEAQCLHFLLTRAEQPDSGLGALFQQWRQAPRPSLLQAQKAWIRATQGKVCHTALARTTHQWLPDSDWHPSLAYVLAWLRVAGGNSVLPPWVGLTHPRTRQAIHALRNVPCSKPSCTWCQEQHQLQVLLPRFFPGITTFRPTPATPDGRSLQQAIVENGMAGTSTLAILPTGGGKSLCYQLPALAHFFRTGVLTVVVSPLQSLMKDQVDNLHNKQGVTCAGYLNGQLTPLERRAMLDKLRLGDLGLIFVAPEQFRSPAFTKALAHREVRAWVFDEAHCLSKWGRDFRPDYLYVSRFIRQIQKERPSPVFCFTATAKPDVVKDICRHFQQLLGIQLARLEGGVARENLDYEVLAVPQASKQPTALRLLQEGLRDRGGAIVFCSRQKTTEEVAHFLQQAGLRCGHFHGGMLAEDKRRMQEDFIAGHLDVMVATNAFGMGVDKPDVRLVIHLDTPGSLENYLQEAGRAGRDQQAARCVLLYDPADLDVQFRLLRNSRLTLSDIQSILKALRAIKTRDRAGEEIIATTGEILRQFPDQQRIDPEAHDADTKVRTAIAWLEEAQILERHENHTQVLPASLLVATVEEARTRLLHKLKDAALLPDYLSIVTALMNCADDDSLSTDELMGLTGKDARTVRAMLRELCQWQLLSDDTELGVLLVNQPPTAERLQALERLETALLTLMREAAPDADAHPHSPQHLHMRVLCDTLRRRTGLAIDPQRLSRLLTALAAPLSEEGGKQTRGFFRIVPMGQDQRYLYVQHSWDSIADACQRRMQLAKVLLTHLHSLRKHNNLLVTCKQGTLTALLQADATLAQHTFKDWDVALGAALLYLDANEVLYLARGKAVFRSAMRIHLHAHASRRKFAFMDYALLRLHYRDKAVQIHVMAEYAKLALENMKAALRFVQDYFSLQWQAFAKRYFSGREAVLQLATSEDAHRRIYLDLANPAQQEIVSAPPHDSLLVLAGPGSGKTRVIVHRVAWLLRQHMVQPEEIMVLTYNRSAAHEVRQRLWQLIGSDAAGVAVQTLHSLAMRLTGTSYTVALEHSEAIDFSAVIRQATDLLQAVAPPTLGTTDTNTDADTDTDDSASSLARARLLAGLRFILVDEYQDINRDRYALISALAGRTLASGDDRLALMAVGDDDQNIYEFDGTNVRYIRQFEADYQARRFHLLENYRSSGHIIACANQVIAPAQERMKAEQTLRINHARHDAPAGGAWESQDPVLAGRVHILEVPNHPLQAAALALNELQRLYALREDTREGGRWGHFAVLGREHKDLDAIYHLARQRGLAVRRIAKNKDDPNITLHTAREGAGLLALLRGEKRCQQLAPRLVLRAATLRRWLRRTYGPAVQEGQGHLHQVALAQFIAQVEVGDRDNRIVVRDVIEQLYEFKLDTLPSSTPRPNAPLLLLTAHSAKGMEFDHVLILDNGNWQQNDDAERRLFYVAMTRARQTLTLCHSPALGHAFIPDLQDLALATQPAPPVLTHDTIVRYETLPTAAVYISWPGKFPAHHAVHRHIAALQVGDPLTLCPPQGSRHWTLRNAQGITVSTMAKAFSPPPHVQAVTVAAIQVRRRSPEDAERGVPCERWEIVLPCLEVLAEPTR